jgi:DNA ligase D-like protein (predicted 3'-phosphoesterase)
MNKYSLKAYREKRDFAVTSEPLGGRIAQGERIFVVQKHSARNLHYDFRLEVDGVLKSWAVPKGPSTNPKNKRLAISTEDHPLEYASFEGIIPEGQYGAGEVIVWDTGTYVNMTEKDGLVVDLSDALEDGHFTVWLNGKKLKGGYAMTRTQRGWILVKMNDEEADVSKDILSEQPRSVKSGRTIEEVADDENQTHKSFVVDR